MPNANNLIGQRFGKLLVHKRTENDKWGKTQWACKCDCGNEKVVNSRELKRGDTTSCGCNYYDSNMAINLVGQRYGRLKVIKRMPNIGNRTAWECVCDCETIKTVTGYELRSGRVHSCGCLRKETASKNATTHGHYYEKLHGVWNSMRQRCTNPNNKDFHHYGGRGITVCTEWNEYSAFRQWALATGYKEGLTIDRKDVDGPYCPHNCRWIPLKDQMTNRRSSLAYRRGSYREN